MTAGGVPQPVGLRIGRPWRRRLIRGLDNLQNQKYAEHKARDKQEHDDVTRHWGREYSVDNSRRY